MTVSHQVQGEISKNQRSRRTSSAAHVKNVESHDTHGYIRNERPQIDPGPTSRIRQRNAQSLIEKRAAVQSMQRSLRQIALWCQLILVSRVAALIAPRVLIGGLSPSHQALVASVALDASGGEWQVVPVVSAQRVVLFDGLVVDGDEWLLQTVAEALDEAEASALVTAGAVGEGPPLEALEAARAAHVELYDLRRPVRTRPTA